MAMRTFVWELPNTLKFYLIEHVRTSKKLSINNEKFHKSWDFLTYEILLAKFFPEKSTIQDLFKTSLFFYFIYF